MNAPRLINNGGTPVGGTPVGGTSNRKYYIWIVIIILVALVIGVGIYMYYRKPKVTKKDNFHASVPHFNNVKSDYTKSNNKQNIPLESKYGKELLSCF